MSRLLTEHDLYHFQEGTQFGACEKLDACRYELRNWPDLVAPPLNDLLAKVA